MIFTKLEHSGCVIENNGKRIVCDPVEIESKLPKLENVVALIITHKHGDHFQPEMIKQIVTKNLNIRIFAPKDLEIEKIAGHSIEKVTDGTELNIDNFNLKFFGKDHAPIIPNQIPCANIGVVINDQIVNPGDPFDSPKSSQIPELLLVPSEAPWIKSCESMEYIKRVRAKTVVPVHNAVLSKFGNDINNNWLKMACEKAGAKLTTLRVGEGIKNIKRQLACYNI